MNSGRQLILLLALLVLCVTGEGNASAGTDIPTREDSVLLAAGEPPLTKDMFYNMIAFVQWSLQLSLLPAEKETAKKQAIETWTNKEANGMALLVLMSLMWTDLPKLAKDDKDALQMYFRSSILQALLNDKDDSDNVALLERYKKINCRLLCDASPEIVKMFLENESIKSRAQEVVLRYQGQLPHIESTPAPDIVQRHNAERRTERYINNNVLRMR